MFFDDANKREKRACRRPHPRATVTLASLEAPAAVLQTLLRDVVPTEVRTALAAKLDPHGAAARGSRRTRAPHRAQRARGLPRVPRERRADARGRPCCPRARDRARLPRASRWVASTRGARSSGSPSSTHRAG